MGLEIQSKNVSMNSATPSEFNFNSEISQYVAGIASFQFSYGNDDHHIEQLSLNLTSNRPSSQKVTVSVTAIMSDSSGNQINLQNSYVTVTVIAWTGASTNAVLLNPAVSVANGGRSDGINLPDSSEPILQAALAGFNFAYSDDDHHVQFLQASVGSQQNGSVGFITATANMKDDSGHFASTQSASGLLIASSTSQPGFVVVPYSDQSPQVRTIPMGTPVKDAVTFITGFQVQFAAQDDHHVYRLGAGPDKVWVDTGDNTQVQTTGVQAWMADKSGNIQNNNKSSCSIIVVGIPA
ncbi:MAG TPA: hypothetical protein VFZ09_26085 [Archangium sp.]|uniref:hypothetical protein n=1 Tax=Archangium sp. TaxID=1872627 RepID=UPI002E314BF9|nr:hypothetical protein [Archangium sp.]HEX5749728.1 hypothetical protein [Archangium sp.]